jgi:GNAT superfamily N-acetyltransferase
VIRPCSDSDAEAIHAIVNDGAAAYRGVVPEATARDPYMPLDELTGEMAAGVRFFGLEESGRLLGVMGIQDVRDVTLIRHAYVRTDSQGRGIGSELLSQLRTHAGCPLLIGTWAAASWAIRFYEKNGFELLPPDRTQELLSTYWDIPPAQAAASVVLADRLS